MYPQAINQSLRQIFGRWRRGFRGTWKASNGHFHIFRKNVLAEGHQLVTANDFVGETVIGLLPERYALRYMPECVLTTASHLGDVAHDARGRRQPTAFPCFEVLSLVVTMQI